MPNYPKQSQSRDWTGRRSPRPRPRSRRRRVGQGTSGRRSRHRRRRRRRRNKREGSRGRWPGGRRGPLELGGRCEGKGSARRRGEKPRRRRSMRILQNRGGNRRPTCGGWGQVERFQIWWEGGGGDRRRLQSSWTPSAPCWARGLGRWYEAIQI